MTNKPTWELARPVADPGAVKSAHDLIICGHKTSVGDFETDRFYKESSRIFLHIG
jgi:hypothetical protein